MTFSQFFDHDLRQVISRPQAVQGLLGWLVTEIGRQPWLISGVLTTADAASSVPGSSIALTLAAYAVVYTGLLISFVVVLTQLALKAADGDGKSIGTRPVPVLTLVS